MCKQEKDASEFRKRRAAADGLQYYCKVCATRKHRAWKYGISVEELDRMLEATRCAICGDEPAPGKTLHIDHDHGTRAVRQPLCNACNVGLGQFRDRRDLLLNAVEYLDGHINWQS